jgi:hypothetical protein
MEEWMRTGDEMSRQLTVRQFGAQEEIPKIPMESFIPDYLTQKSSRGLFLTA